jgi:hypothetical protein
MKTAYHKLPIVTLSLRPLRHAAHKTCANRSDGCTKANKLSRTPPISSAKLQCLASVPAQWPYKSPPPNKPEASITSKSP